MSYPAETVDGTIVQIVNREAGTDPRDDVFTDEDGNMYVQRTASGTRKLIPVVEPIPTEPEPGHGAAPRVDTPGPGAEIEDIDLDDEDDEDDGGEVYDDPDEDELLDEDDEDELLENNDDEDDGA